MMASLRSCALIAWIGLTCLHAFASPQEQMDALLSDQFEAREKAQVELWEMGNQAADLLRKASTTSKDPEQRVRASQILRKVELRLTPQTPPAVLKAVEEYSGASSSQKITLLQQLAQTNAWYQVIKLYSEETNPEVLTGFNHQVGDVTMLAARSAIAREETDEALKILELMPSNMQSLQTLAEFHRSHGTLQQEIEKAARSNQLAPAAWRLALYCSAGDLTAARLAAREDNQTYTDAALAILQGDPLPWINYQLNHHCESDIQRHFLQMAKKRWMGEFIRPSEIEVIRQATEQGDDYARHYATTLLFAAGASHLGEQALTRERPQEAALHFEALGRFDEALKIYQIDPQQPAAGLTRWIEERSLKLIDEGRELQREDSSMALQELLQMASMLDMRHLHELSAQCYGPAMMNLAEENEELFLQFIGELSEQNNRASPSGKLALELATQWAGVDPLLQEKATSAILGEQNPFTQSWQAWIIEEQPDLPWRAQLTILMALQGHLGDEQNLTDQWVERAWKSYRLAADDSAKSKALNLINQWLFYGRSNSDAQQTLKLWDALDPNSRVNLFWASRLEYFLLEKRWKDALELIDFCLDHSENSSTYTNSSVYGHRAFLLSKLGKTAAAKRNALIADQLSLGNPATAQSLIYVHMMAENPQQVNEWIQRSALLATSEEYEQTFLDVLKIFIRQTAFEQGNWRVAAAVTEVLSCQAANAIHQDKNLGIYASLRAEADLAKALADHAAGAELDRAKIIQAHAQQPTSGALADYFFPALRKAGQEPLLREIFADSWQRVTAELSRYPKHSSGLNTAAWLASRAKLQLKEAEKMSLTSLKLSPNEPAYLDTLAETYFALGDRKRAVQFSEQALNFSKQDPMIRWQHLRFLTEKITP